MSAIKADSWNKRSVFLFYSLLFVLIALFVFVVNDETQPIVEIFRLDYLIPVLIYAFGPILLSFNLFQLLRKKLHFVISLVVSAIIGVPLGLKMIEGFFILLSSI